jgi:hypothetical protein
VAHTVLAGERIVNGGGDEEKTTLQRDREKAQEPPNQLCDAVLGGVWIGAGEEDKLGDGPGREGRLEPAPEARVPVPHRRATSRLITYPV